MVYPNQGRHEMRTLGTSSSVENKSVKESDNCEGKAAVEESEESGWVRKEKRILIGQFDQVLILYISLRLAVYFRRCCERNILQR